MAVQYAPQKLRVPPGFQNILEGFAREVLREQPEDIIQFGAQYFKTQLSIRDETGKDEAKKGENLEKLQKGEEVDIDLNDPEVQAAATKIQASFRGHKVREGHKAKMKEDKVVKDQASKESISSTAGEAEKPAEKPSTEEVDIDLNDPEVGAAALKIQASFRGLKARSEVKKMKSSETVATPAESAKEEKDAAEPPVQDQPAEEPEAEVKESSAAVGQESSQQPQEEEIDIDLNDPEVNKAAMKIQATFRGHKTRKDIKDASPSPSKESVQPSESTQEAAPETAAESQETVPEPIQEDIVEAEPAAAETTEDAAPSESQEAPSESQDAAETDSAKPDEEPSQETQPADEEGEKTEETPEGEGEKTEDALEVEAEKVEDSPEAEAEKKEDAPEGDGEKSEDTPEGEIEQVETALEGEGEKAEDAPEADKTEDAPEAKKTEDPPVGDAEKPEETPQGEGESAPEAKEGES